MLNVNGAICGGIAVVVLIAIVCMLIHNTNKNMKKEYKLN